MRFRGSNEKWDGDGSVIDAGDPGRRRAGPVRRLWRRLRGLGPASEPEGAAALGGSARRSPEGGLAAYLAAPRSVASPDGAIRHVAAATGGPFAETRLAREIRRLVASLGDTRGEIASSLEHHGVRAVPHGRGPVAHFLEAVIGADPNVKSVVVDADSVVAELRAWWRPTVLVELPPVTRAFTVAFDACCYPRLLPDGYRAGADADRGGE